MVSKASEDLPDPDSPVITVSVSRGMSTSTPLRLCSRAPRTLIWVSINLGVPVLFSVYRWARDRSNANGPDGFSRVEFQDPPRPGGDRVQRGGGGPEPH